MLTRLKNIFKREKQEDLITASISMYSDESGELFVDVQMKDTSDKSIEHIIAILSMYSPAAFIEVNKVLKQQCKSNNEDDLYIKIVTRFVEVMGPDYWIDKTKEKNSESPMISPSEIL